MSLDNKLREILSDSYDIVGKGATVRLNHDGAIAQIKQAFADEGYVKIPQGTVGKVDGVKIFSINGDSNIMTGQEFYAAYKRELGFGSLDDVKDMARGEELKAIEVAEMKCDEAAKRAAGLEPGL